MKYYTFEELKQMAFNLRGITGNKGDYRYMG